MFVRRLIILSIVLVMSVALVWIVIPDAEREGVKQPAAEHSPREGPFARYIGDEDHIAVGKRLYANECAHCHGDLGEGFIGPNLTDQYWVHGPENEDLFRVISEGALDAGMTGYEDLMTQEERSQLVAYIRSIEGSNPPNALEPQGERHPEPS